MLKAGVIRLCVVWQTTALMKQAKGCAMADALKETHHDEPESAPDSKKGGAE